MRTVVATVMAFVKSMELKPQCAFVENLRIAEQDCLTPAPTHPTLVPHAMWLTLFQVVAIMTTAMMTTFSLPVECAIKETAPIRKVAQRGDF